MDLLSEREGFIFIIYSIIGEGFHYSLDIPLIITRKISQRENFYQLDNYPFQSKIYIKLKISPNFNNKASYKFL